MYAGEFRDSMPYFFFHLECAKSIYNANRRRLQFTCAWLCAFICVQSCIPVQLPLQCTCICTFISYLFMHTFTRTCGRVYVQCGTLLLCLPDSTYSLFTLLCSFPSPSLFVFSLPPFHPSSFSRSARLARTCMSVDSVLCLLPWHAPTSLQCSPVCINWQRDSGYVVCRAGSIENRERGREGKQKAT